MLTKIMIKKKKTGSKIKYKDLYHFRDSPVIFILIQPISLNLRNYPTTSKQEAMGLVKEVGF